ncbi:MAG: GNAT family N-acetyltransferase [Acholeplasmatales bacterium]|nr:GNAT family N-acetyltransferase [Acholeplasmatales bacterium]
MLDLKLITSENLDYAVRVENEIFEEYNAKNNYLSSLENSSQSQFFMACEGDICIGVTGIYAYKNDRDSAWIGFFGLKGKYRNSGLGSKVLKLTEKYAGSLGYKYIRLFTDKDNNDIAINFYKKNGYTFEDYYNENEALKDEFNVVIGSKSLIKGEEVPLWDNKFINLTKQSYKQQYLDISEIELQTSMEEETDISNIETEKIKGEAKHTYKIVRKYTSDKDIKYRGPLSYRYIRVIAWIAFAITQFVLVVAMGQGFLGIEMISEDNLTLLSFVGSVSIPFFLVATFSQILTRKRTFKKLLIIYGAAYLAVALAIIFVYDRYIGGILVEVSDSKEQAKDVILSLYDKKMDINVFADLFFISLFNFFLNYTPSGKWGKKRIVLFRTLIIIPIGFALTSIILKGLTLSGTIKLPFEFYPFLTTKPVLIYVIFIIMSIWIKNREKVFIGLGMTRKEYQTFLNTNKNSLSFSILTSILFLSISLIDLICVALFPSLSFFEFGKCIGLFLAIPFIMLFSYTRTHNNNDFDIILPFAGVGLVVFAYIEAIYQLIKFII